MIGIDIESIPRLDYLLRNKPKIIKRFFSTYEWQYAEKKAKMAQTLTGIWCAKEAVVKAFSAIEPIFVTDVNLKYNSSGAPYIFSISNERLMKKYKVHVSISHSKDYAIANSMISII